MDSQRGGRSPGWVVKAAYMADRPVEWRRGAFLVSTDRRLLDPSGVLALLRATHWGSGMQRGTLGTAIANSVCFGVYREKELCGFGRVVTDLATYGYLTDVVIAGGYRGQGLGRWLTECILAHPQLQGFRRLALLTLDAPGLYARLGFEVGPGSLTYMERRSPEGGSAE